MKLWILLLLLLSYFLGLKANPYLLLEDHPAKPILDVLFADPAIIGSKHSLENAGFSLYITALHKVIVAKHPNLQGYVVKTYLSEFCFPEEEWRLIKRIEGMRKVRDCITSHGFQSLIKTPQKWIYPLSKSSSAHPQKIGHVLIAEDMQIVSHEENQNFYLTKITKKHLKALHTIISEVALMDCVYIRNIPFCEDGKIAFVDTDLFNVPREVICYKCLARQLSPKMQKYWKKLCKQNKESL